MNERALDRLRQQRMENAAAGESMDAMRGRFGRLEDRHTNGAAPLAVSAFQLFQTPPDLAARLVDLVAPTDGARILEPSAGLGRLIDALLPRDPLAIVAVEIAADCAKVLFDRNLPRVTLLQRDFLGVAPASLAPFDFVLMNPPFKNGTDIVHIKHALRFLRPGGTLGAFCYDGPRQNDHLQKLAVASGGSWCPLGQGAFRSSNTNAATVMLTIRTKGIQ